MLGSKLTAILLLRPEERAKVIWATSYFFLLLASYFVLRPIRDELGVAFGAANMQWLFTGTFLGMLLIVPVFGYVTKKFRLAVVLRYSYLFFIGNIVLFFVLSSQGWLKSVLPVIFFIWLSVFNLFAVSLFWSLMTDIFSTEEAKRLFGIIAVGGSLGAILGPVLTQVFLTVLDYESLFLLAAALLLLAMGTLLQVLKLAEKARGRHVSEHSGFKDFRLSHKSVFNAISLVFASAYLKRLVLFMFMYTSVSTFLYFEQAHILESTITDSVQRIKYFSRIDLFTNVLSVGGQFLLTARVIRSLGLALSLCLIPILVGVGFLVLSVETSLYVIAITMVLHRAGNLVVLRPGREMLYTLCSREEKYRAKNFIDTAVYRGGDALSGWAFAGLTSLSLGLSKIALIGVPLVALWSYLGFVLGWKADGHYRKGFWFKNVIK